MRFHLGVVFFFCLSTCAFAQSSTIDSLQQLSKNLKGTKQVDALNALAWAYASFDIKKMKDVAEQARQLSLQLNYDKGIAEALISEGFCETNVGNLELSILKYKQSVEISKKSKQTAIQGFALARLALNYQDLGQLDSSEYFLRQSYEILKDSMQPYYLSFLYMILADNYGLKNESDKQLEYLKLCWAIRDNLAEKRYLVYTGERLAAYYTQRGEYTEALTYLRKSQKVLGADTLDNEEISIIHKERAIIYIRQGYYPLALDLLAKSIKFYERNLFKKELMILLMHVGDAFVDLDNYEASLKNYFKALDIAEKNHYELERSKLLIQIGRIYFFLDQFQLGNDFAIKGLNVAQQSSHQILEASALNLLGLIADQENKNIEALRYFNQALTIRKKISDKVGVAGTVYNMGIVFEKQNDFKKALDYQLQSLVLEESLNHQLGMAFSYQSLAELYTKLRDYSSAEKYLAKAEQVATKIKSGKVLVDVYKNRRDLLILKSKFREAAAYTILYENLKDSIFNTGLSDRIATLQYIFELDQRDYAIEKLSQQHELQQEKLDVQKLQIRQQWIIIMAGSISFMGICILAYFIYRYSARIKLLNNEISKRNSEIIFQGEELKKSNAALHKLNREISEQKEEIQAQGEELTESNQAILGINENLETRIEERTAELKQAYKELDTFFYRSSHDFRRPLTTFMGLAEVAKITLKEKASLALFDKVNETAHNLDKMLMKLQSISDLGVQELMYKEIFLEDCFVRELNHFDQDLLQKSIRKEILVAPRLSFYSYPALIKIIVENLIENAISFRGATDSFVRLKAYQKDNEIVIEVSDNGQGIEKEYKDRVFDMYFRGNEHSKGNGLGLYIVKKTVLKLKGRVELESSIGKGTTIHIFLPSTQG